MFRYTSDHVTEAVSLEEAKLALQIYHHHFDGNLTGALASETARYEAFTRRFLRQAAIEWPAGAWGDIHVCAEPVRQVLGVRYFDQNHVEQSVDPVNWWAARAAGRPGWTVGFGTEFSAPALSDRPNPIWVDVSVGTDGDTGTKLGAEFAARDDDKRAIIVMASRILDEGQPMREEEMRNLYGHRRLLW